MADQLEQDLRRIGLSDKEAKVYLASLALGPATAQQIAAKARVIRPTTYVMIEALVKRGLMSVHHQGKKRYFSAANPENLDQVYDQQIDELREKKRSLASVVSHLKKRAKLTQAGVAMYEGADGLATAQRELADLVATIGTVDVIAADEEALARLIPAGLEPKDGHAWRVLLAHSSSPFGRSNKGECRILPKVTSSFASALAVCGDAVFSVEAADGAYAAIITRSADTAAAIRALFEAAWAVAE
ncbi:MAG: helix-turn-helix domain-containing protein [Patescibacteria group bacterium]|nr:helix-turn-helix domain-containing protein [Patescibacteria group bacterium]